MHRRPVRRFVVSMSDDERRLIDELVSVASTRGDDAREALARRLRAAADELHPSLPSSSPRGHARTARGRRRNDDDDDDDEGNEGNENNGFDFAAYPSRHVALHVMYAGWDYRGFASQGAERDGVRTVEEALFRALKRVRLIAPDATWKTCDYTRCGRTDAGVSALGQVVSARLRCRVPRRDDDDDDDDLSETGRLHEGDEIDYPAVLNRALPRDIRILGWTYVPPAFSARFDCDYRHYKYFFTDWNGLDVRAMNEAASAFVGEHDFRNFCKMDARNVHNYRRRIDSCRVVVNGRTDGGFVRVGAMGLGGGGGGGDASSGGKEGDEDKAGAQLATSQLATSQLAAGEPPGVAHIEVVGTAFLWHQVRCIASVLFLVGLGREPPGVVAHMLDLARCPRKPQYEMAPEEPLLLWRCGFRDVSFRLSDAARYQLELHVAQCTHGHVVRAGMWAETFAHVRRGGYDDDDDGDDGGGGGGRGEARGGGGGTVGRGWGKREGGARAFGATRDGAHVRGAGGADRAREEGTKGDGLTGEPVSCGRSRNAWKKRTLTSDRSETRRCVCSSENPV